jgi:predicted nucleic acid-binding protein
MPRFVVDASIASAWCFPDERTDYTDAVFSALASSFADAVAPSLWAYEIGNSVLMGVRRKRITQPDAEQFLFSLQDLNVGLFGPPSSGELVTLARTHDLTVYDAAYFSLARQTGLPLATLDRQLIRAAEAAEHPIFIP